MPESILVAYQDGVARITLNRPEVLNSFTRAMARELTEELSRIARES